MSINKNNYWQIQNKAVEKQAKLVAVSKTRPLEDIQTLYNLGHRDFGENRISELVEKYEALPKDIRWHFIGHLQRNKVKYIAPFVHLIHAVDSLRLLKEIDKRAANEDRVIPVLLQYHIAQEATKYGLDDEEAATLLDTLKADPLPHVLISGVMGMATYTDNQEQVLAEFSQLRQNFTKLKTSHFSDVGSFQELSMGMSGDYLLALQKGSTMIRVGSAIFGSRD